MKKYIKEIIVVEGRDDITAVKAAVDAEVIAVNGFSVGKNIEKIKGAYERTGIIVLTDPDNAGNNIRNFIQKDILKQNMLISAELKEQKRETSV